MKIYSWKKNIVTDLCRSSRLFAALCYVSNVRSNNNHNNSIWYERLYWHRDKTQLRQDLQQGKYNFQPFKVGVYQDKSFTQCDAKDAVVIKALQSSLSKYLSNGIPKSCVSVKGRGGIKAGVRKALNWSDEYKYYFKSDIKSYYKNISHELLYSQLFRKIKDKKIQTLIKKYCENLIDKGGVLETPSKGIVKGGSSTPIGKSIFGAVRFSDEKDQASTLLALYG